MCSETDLRAAAASPSRSTPRTARSILINGVYREVVRNKKLVFTWAWRSTPERELVTVLIEPDGDGSLLTLTHEQFFDEAARDRHSHGWTGSLDKLERYPA